MKANSEKRYCTKIKKNVVEARGACPNCNDKADVKWFRKAAKNAESDMARY
jgi:hypothetical protein